MKSDEPSRLNATAEDSRAHKILEHITSYHAASPLDRAPSLTILRQLEEAQKNNMNRYLALREERFLEFDFDELIHDPYCRLIAGLHQAHYLYAQGQGAFMAAWEDRALILQGKRFVQNLSTSSEEYLTLVPTCVQG